MSTTHTSLLEALLDGRDDLAWQRFDATYRPIIVRFARKLGLNPHDAEDAAQQTIIAFCKAHKQGKYDRNKGHLKNWLLGIAQHKIAHILAQCGKQPIPASQRSSVHARLQRISDHHSLSQIWDHKWRRHLINRCLQKASKKFTARDLLIFRKLTIDQRPVDEVAREMNVSRDSIYQIKHRILEYLVSVNAQFQAPLES